MSQGERSRGKGKRTRRMMLVSALHPRPPNVRNPMLKILVRMRMEHTRVGERGVLLRARRGSLRSPLESMS